MLPQRIDIRLFKVVYRHLQLVLIAHITISDFPSRLRITGPHDVIDTVYVLQKRCDALQAVGQLGGDGVEIDATALLEVGKLGDLQAVEHHLPAHAPSRQRRRLPVVFFELDVMLAQVDADGSQRIEIELLNVIRGRLEDYLELHVLVKTIGVVAVTAVSWSARRLYVSDFVRLRPQHAQEGLWRHGAGADLRVVGLLEDASPLRPELLEAKDQFLIRGDAGIRHAKLE